MRQSENGRLTELFTERALSDLLEMIDRQKAADWLFDRIWPGESGERCPKCRATLSPAMQRTYRRFRKTFCSACGSQFRAGSGNSAFYHVRMDPHEIVVIAALLGGKVSIQEIAKVVGVGDDTIYLWRRRLSGLTLGDARGFHDDE
jgi:transposase-like protein